jgi:hypothetical protein
MRLGWFETVDPVPELNNVHVFALIPGWLDAGESASMALNAFENNVQAKPLASLVTPGEFFDFTRYRPTSFFEEGKYRIRVPSALAIYGHTETNDFIFLRIPEPHMKAEEYIESVLQIFKYFNVTRYCLLGSVYEMLPHTRPPLITGRTSSQVLKNAIELAKVVPSNYEGPTSILSRVGQEAEKLDIETLNLIVHIPGYFQIANDHRGEIRLLEALELLYRMPVPQKDIEIAKRETEQMKESAEAFLKVHPELRQMLTELEKNYDIRVNGEQSTQLSPEVEEFLQKMSRRFESE